MTTEYAVRAETHEGKTMTLRRGFVSRGDAENHPVIMSLWKRVWIEALGPMSDPSEPPTLPPLPWNWVASKTPTANALYHIYLIDATGRKIAAIWGRHGEKELTANRIVDLVNGVALTSAEENK